MTTLTTILASIESIPETNENYRAIREAVRGLKLLMEQNDRSEREDRQ